MNTLLDRLCDALDDELLRQETLLAICRKKREAIRALDVGPLEAHTAALETVLRETFEAEDTRHRLLHEAVERMGLPPEKHTLSQLIAVLPEPWKSRLDYFQCQLRKTLETTQAVTRAYSRELRHYLRLTQTQFARLGLESKEQKAGLYGPRAWKPEMTSVSSALVDQRG